jgi:hypothetical protein
MEQLEVEYFPNYVICATCLSIKYNLFSRGNFTHMRTLKSPLLANEGRKSKNDGKMLKNKK